MKILYFAFLRQRTGLGEETVDRELSDGGTLRTKTEWIALRKRRGDPKLTL